MDDLALKENEKEAICEATRMLKEQFPVKEVILFGSKARRHYDWSHHAMDNWPERVREKCKTNKSFAIVQGLT